MIQCALLPGFWDVRLLITNKTLALIWKSRWFEENYGYNSSDICCFFVGFFYKKGTCRQIEGEKVSS